MSDDSMGLGALGDEEGFAEATPETETPVTKKEKKAKAPKAPAEPKPPREKGTVVFAAFHKNGNVVTGNDFSIHLLSVSGRAYNFQDLPEANKWITRRVYNGEQVASEVILLNDMISNRRAIINVQKLASQISEYMASVEAAKTQALTRVAPFLNKLKPMVQPINDGPEPMKPIQEAVEALVSALTHGTQVSKPPVTETMDEGASLIQWSESIHSVASKVASACTAIETFAPTLGEIFPDLSLPEEYTGVSESTSNGESSADTDA